MIDVGLNRPGGAGAVPVRLAMVAAFLFLAPWLIVHNTVAAERWRVPSAIEAALMLPTGEEEIRRAGVHALEPSAQPTLAQLAAMERAIRSEPLAAEPFYAKGLADAGRVPERARSLMEEARRRAPAWRNPRIFLLETYLRSNRADEAARELVVLTRLLPRAKPVLLNVMLDLQRSPAGHRALMRHLAVQPKLRSEFLAYAANKGADAGQLFRAMLPSAADPDTADKRALIRALVDRGDISRAYIAWINFLPMEQLDNVAPVYDGNFVGLPGVPPFNWSLTHNADANAERSKSNDFSTGTALEVSYSGRKPTLVAQQLLMLSPGDYRLAYLGVGSGTGSSSGGALRWQMNCVGAEMPLMTNATLPQEPARVLTNFTVPATGCSSQWLVLVGVLGEVPSAIEGSYSGVSVALR